MNTKLCGRCGDEKLLHTDFHRQKKAKDGHQSRCKVCSSQLRGEYYARKNQDERKYDVARKQEIRAAIDEIKSTNPCTDCVRFFPPVAMDFDHVRGPKSFEISAAAHRGMSLNAIKTEILKCELVCACCHRIRTAARTLQPNPADTNS